MRGHYLGALIHRLSVAVARWYQGRCPDAELGLFLTNDDNVAWSLRQRLRFARILFGNNSPFHRGLKLLLQNLTPHQQNDFLRYGYFHVVGGRTRRVYRISKGRQVNVHQLDGQNRRVCIWCFYPIGNLVEGDVMLAQKLALELFEDDALAVANRLSNFCEPLGA